MDRRLVQTFLDLLLVIIMHRHRNQGLLSELGGHLMGAHARPDQTDQQLAASHLECESDR